MTRTAAVLCIVAVLAAATPAKVQGAGLFLAPRGVRPLALGGAFVASADDVNALSYNPAGLADSANTVQIDASLPLQTSTYTRSVYGDGVYEPPVRGEGLGLPSPTIGVVHSFGLKDLRFGLAVAVDTPLVQNWPSTDVDPATPQRYAAGNFDGTALSKIIAGTGYRVSPWLSVGATLQLLVGTFAAVTTASTCDGVICTHPEDPSYDAAVQVRATGLMVPGLQLGAQLRPTPWLALGLAWESGYRIDSVAKLGVRLPSAAAYNDASVSPSEPVGRMAMTLPQQFRLGLAAYVHPDVRVELAYIYDPWSVHRDIAVGTGNATVNNMLGIGQFALRDLTIPRGFDDTWSLRLGAEWRPSASGIPWVVRAGTLYEPAAVPNSMLTPMAMDLDKILGAVGAQYAVGPWSIEATYAYIFMFSQLVTGSQIRQTNPTDPTQGALTTVGNGLYTSGAHVLGLGARLDI